MNILGIDPGISGGIAVIKTKIDQTPKIIIAKRMPTLKLYGKKIVDVLVLEKHIKDIYIDVAIIEKVHAMPRQGVTSSFQFGRSFGAIEAICHIISKRIDYVAPAVWKKAMGIGSSKKESLDMARFKFGNDNMWTIKSNDGIAEAALLCLFWIEKFKNKTNEIN